MIYNFVYGLLSKVLQRKKQKVLRLKWQKAILEKELNK
jgi:hypothetical protein